MTRYYKVGDSSIRNFLTALEETVKILVYGNLNVIGPHKVTGSGIIRCGFVAMVVAMWEEVCHSGVSFEVLYMLKLSLAP